MNTLRWIGDHLADIAALLGVIIALTKLRKLEISVNGRFSELLRSRGESEHAKGVDEGRQLSITEGQARVVERERVEDRAKDKQSRE